MESNKTFWIIILIVTVSTLVETKSMPHRDSYAARSLLSVSPPSESPSSSPAPGPEVENTIATPASSPIEIDIDSPSPSPGAPADSISPANAPTTSSPSPSPGAPADSISPTNAPTRISPSPSPEAPANAPTTDSPFPSEEVEMDYPEALVDSASPANPPTTEMEIDSPSPSPEGPGENPGAPSRETLVSSAKTLLKQTFLSPEIKTICSKTDNPELCESSVAPLLTAAVKPDASSVLVLAIQASINATKAAKPAVDKAAAPDCQELYDDAVANLEDAINAVNESDIATVNTNLSAAMTDYGTCNDGFEESGEPNPLADVADKLHKMVSNCLAISSLIK